MSYFPDLSPYHKETNIFRVGWLDGIHPYKQGIMPSHLLEKLCKRKHRMEQCALGQHTCELCTEASRDQLTDPWFEENTSNGEFRIIGKDGRIYAAPQILPHYIVKHGYLPPDEFLEALEKCPRVYIGWAPSIEEEVSLQRAEETPPFLIKKLQDLAENSHIIGSWDSNFSHCKACKQVYGLGEVIVPAGPVMYVACPLIPHRIEKHEYRPPIDFLEAIEQIDLDLWMEEDHGRFSPKRWKSFREVIADVKFNEVEIPVSPAKWNSLFPNKSAPPPIQIRKASVTIDWMQLLGRMSGGIYFNDAHPNEELLQIVEMAVQKASAPKPGNIMSWFINRR